MPTGPMACPPPGPCRRNGCPQPSELIPPDECFHISPANHITHQREIVLLGVEDSWVTEEPVPLRYRSSTQAGPPPYSPPTPQQVQV